MGRCKRGCAECGCAVRTDTDPPVRGAVPKISPRQAFGIRLTRLRESRSLTQYQLADKTGLQRAALSHYEKARREPDIETLVKLADFFRVSLDELVGREGGEIEH